MDTFKKNKDRLDYLLKHRNFIIPSFEIYNGVSGLYDLGPPACAIKNNIVSYWRDFFVIEDDMLEIESTILTPHKVLETSGHVNKFHDFMIKDQETGKYHRADHLLEEVIDFILQDQLLTPELINEYKIIKAKADTYSCEDLDDLLKNKFKNKLQELYKNINISDSNCKPVNLMFQTNIDPSNKQLSYLRPETAQGIFVNFPRLLASNGNKMPVIAAQIGKSFRNEITPKNGLLRLREFSMAEIEHFVDPDDKSHIKYDLIKNNNVILFPKVNQVTDGKVIKVTLKEAIKSKIIENETMAYYISRVHMFLIDIGIKSKYLRFRQHLDSEMAHYASDCWDAEIYTSYGWVECVGIADRACYDLRKHSNMTKTKMFAKEIFNPPIKKTYGKPKFNRKLINMTFDKSINKTLCDYIIEKLQQETFAKNAISNLENQGYFVLSYKNKELKIISEMISVELKTKNVSERQYIPSVIEPSFGISRILYALFEHSFFVPEKGNRVIMKFKSNISPIKCAVLPLIAKNQEMIDYANIIITKLRSAKILSKIDKSGAGIGKQYSRYDELGVQCTITVDRDTIQKNNELFETVTIRDRDTRNQTRLHIDDLISKLSLLFLQL